MGLFDKFRNRFIKQNLDDIPVDDSDSVESEDDIKKFHENNHNITEEVMDILLSKEQLSNMKASEVVISEYDAGDVDLLELDNENLENNSTKNVVVHDSLDGIDEPLRRAKIIGDIPEQVSFDVEKNE